MQQQHLNDEELAQVLGRAREISEQSRPPASGGDAYQEYIRAAEEMGIPSEAVLLALREMQLVPSVSCEVGQMVFAPSTDGYWYPARVTALHDWEATVTFLSGGDHRCPRVDLRPLSLVPGRKIEADIKHWGWWGCMVERYDEEAGKVRVVHDDWTGEKETVILRKVRLSRSSVSPENRRNRRNSHLTALIRRWAVAAGGVGLLAGILLDRLLGHLMPF